MKTFEHFVNPFNTCETVNAQLFCLSSGQPASEAVAVDRCQYVEAGEFIDKCLVARCVQFPSYVRYLQEYCKQQAELQNLEFPRQDAIVQSFCRDGATVKFSDDG